MLFQTAVHFHSYLYSGKINLRKKLTWDCQGLTWAGAAQQSSVREVSWTTGLSYPLLSSFILPVWAESASEEVFTEILSWGSQCPYFLRCVCSLGFTLQQNYVQILFCFASKVLDAELPAMSDGWSNFHCNEYIRFHINHNIVFCAVAKLKETNGLPPI